MEDLAEQVKAGNLDFDVVIAAPDAMRVVGQLGTILGPRGLIPYPKGGTVTPNVAEAVANAKAGQATYRVDKAGIIHTTIGQVGFTVEQIQQNVQALLSDIRRAKPATSKVSTLRKLLSQAPWVLVSHQIQSHTAQLSNLTNLLVFSDDSSSTDLYLELSPRF